MLKLDVSIRSCLAAAALICLGASAVLAAEPKLDSVSGDWSVFSLAQEGGTLCYIASAPKKQEGSAPARGDSYLLITHRSAKVDEVSASAGAAFAKDSGASVTVDGAKHALFTKDDLAWAKTEKDDAKLVAALKKGKKAVFQGKAEKGSAKDTYSLKGITAAYKRMKALCK